jgi:hypothetical protein
MGSRTLAALELCDVLVYRVERPEEAAQTVTAALDIAFNGDLATAVLLSQRLLGAKWVKCAATIHGSTAAPRCGLYSKIAATLCS